MEWITDNLQVLLAFAAAVAFWLNQRREARQRSEEEGPPPFEDAPGHPAGDRESRPPEIPEPLRRVFEQMGIPLEPEKPEPPVEPEPVFRPLPPPLPAPLPAPPVPTLVQVPSPPPVAARSHSGPGSSVVIPAPILGRPKQGRRNIGLSRLRALLHDPQQARQAILLREVLGRPAGLRKVTGQNF